LVLNPDKSYEILVDLVSLRNGTLFDDWELFGPKEIDDPAHAKPADWVEVREIVDDKVKKPADWVTVD
jgi:protein-tyrosine-phosphatase